MRPENACCSPKNLDMSERRRLPLPELLYYQKPSLGRNNNKRDGKSRKQPLQVNFPSGAVGIALPSSATSTNTNNDNEDSVVIVSETENDNVDVTERRWITMGFLALALVNLIITSLMFQYADTTDVSAVVKPSNYGVEALPQPFEEIRSTRNSTENTYFTFIVLSIICGSLAATFQSALGLSVYGLTVAIMYIFGTAAQPYFVFSFRSFFDIWMLYMALVLRSKLLFTVLPMRIRTGW